jgi:hypothetical protein
LLVELASVPLLQPLRQAVEVEPPILKVQG